MADVLFDGAQYYRIHSGELHRDKQCEYCDILNADFWIGVYKRFKAITIKDPQRGNIRNMFASVDNEKYWKIVRWALGKYSELIIKHFGKKTKEDVEEYFAEKDRWKQR